MKVSFVIPTINQTTMVDECLSSLRKFHQDEEVVVVDDGSTEAVCEYVRALCVKYNAKFMHNHTNRGFSGSVNRGMDSCTGDIFVLTNNDIVFTQNVSKALVDNFKRDETIGIIGGLLFYPNQTIQHGGVVHLHTHVFVHRSWHKKIEEAPESNKSEFMITVTGALYAIRRKMSETIGLLNDQYFLAYEDTEYSLRAWARGWKVLYCPDVQAIHAEGATRGRTPELKKAKSPEWYAKELQTEAIFKRDLEKLNLPYLKRVVDNSNSGLRSSKLEIMKDSCGVIGINRAGALGDVLMLTGIVRRLKELHPKFDIHVATFTPGVLFKNKNITKIVKSKNQLMANIIYDLDLVYESNPKMNTIQAYANYVFGNEAPPLVDLRPEMYSSESDLHSLIVKLPPRTVNGKFVVVHPGVGWKNRTWQKHKWTSVINNLADKGFKIVVIGAGSDFIPEDRFNVINAREKLNLAEIRELCKAATVFIGMDSGMFHIAMTTETNVIGLFTVANPEFRTHHGRTGKTIAMVPQVPCRFCLHEEKAPVTFCDCTNVKKYTCLDDLSPSKIIDCALDLLNA